MMDDKQPSPSILASVPDAAEASFVQTLRQNCRRQIFAINLKLLISALIVSYLVHTRRLGITGIRAAWRSPVQLWCALALLILLPFVLTLRWQILLRALEYRIPYRNILSMTFMVVFFDTIMPGGTADVIRGYYFDRTFRLQHRARAVSTVVVDRFLGVTGLSLAALGALVIRSHSAPNATALHSLAMISGAVSLVFLLVFLFLVSERNIGRMPLDWICSRIRFLKLLLTGYDTFRSYAKRTGPMLQALGLSVAGNALTVTSFLLLGSVAGESHLRPFDYFCLVPVGLFVAQIPISPGGIGVGHLGFYSLFEMAGSQLGAGIFSLFILVRFVSSLPGLFCFLWTGRQVHNRVGSPTDKPPEPDGRDRWATVISD